MLKLTDLIPTHNKLRSIGRFNFYLERFENGNKFTIRDKKIAIVHTEDGLYYIFDGHHELTAAMAAKIELDISAVNIIQFNYNDLSTINFNTGYVTPFDPRTHVRKSDFLWWKQRILNIYDGESSLSETWAIRAIEDYCSGYKELRTAQSLQDLIPRGELYDAYSRRVE